MARADVLTLYAFDHELARAGRVASNSLIAEIRLTWWLEVLAEIFEERPVKAHPVARSLAGLVRRHGLSREWLQAMIDARIAALDHPLLDRAQAISWADGVTGSAAMLAATILDPASPARAAAPGGRLWGLTLLYHSRATEPDISDSEIRSGLLEANRAARRLGAAAFPAVLPATLTRGGLGKARQGEFTKRLRLFWAVATGKL
jgi:phytoene synthase